jgi:CRISPR-associated protein Csb2
LGTPCGPAARSRARGAQKIIGDDGVVFFVSSLDALTPSEVTLPLDSSTWADRRKKLLSDLKNLKMPKAKRMAAEATLPERLSDALAVDTSDWQAVGWSSPPPLRKVVYDRPSVGPLPPIRPKKSAPASNVQLGFPEVARFVLAGRPAPRIEEALRIGDLARLALISKFGRGSVPAEILGRDDNGPLREDPAHSHAFFLPEDDDGDGRIDHLVIYCHKGFSPAAKRALDGLTRLWFERGAVDEETGERPRQEWRLALEDIASRDSVAGSSRLLHAARTWQSVTPLFKTRFDKKRPTSFEAVVDSYRHEITREWEKRYPAVPAPSVEPITATGSTGSFVLDINGRPQSPFAFVRTRHGRGGRRSDMSGGFFMLTFDNDVCGPIALGWGAHFGLGLFAAVRTDRRTTG